MCSDGRVVQPPSPAREPGSRSLVAVAVLGVAMVLATLLWFGWDDSAEPDGAASERAGAGAGASASKPGGVLGPGGREVDPANHRGAGRGFAAHQALPAELSPDPSPHGALEGRVVDWDTRVGIAGAELAFVSEGVVHETTTGPDGRYRFEAPLGGRWSLGMVTAEGYLPYAPELGRGSVVWIASPKQKLDRADLFLHPAIDYLGEVVDAEGQPVADAQIELFGAESGERALVGVDSSFTSDADGRFEFQAPDFAILEASHPDHPPGRALVDGSAQLSRHLKITLGGAPAPSDALISGRVVDASGAGVEGVEVAAVYLRMRRDALGRSPTTVSDSEGGFVLAPLDANPYVVRASPPGRPFVQSARVEPGAVVELRIDDGLALEGRLVDEDGVAVVAGTVELLRVIGPLRRARVAGLSVFDPGGVFRFGGLTEGSYELQAIAQGRARSEPVAVSVPHSGDPVRVVLGLGASVHGLVVDSDSGEPIAQASVSVHGLGQRDSVLPPSSSTVSEVDGSFELRGVAPGRVSIEVRAPNHDARIVSGVELEAGERHGPVEVALAPVAEGQRATTKLAGIGVEIGASRDAIVVIRVVAGGGAEAAGIVGGDRITAVDGVAVVELGFERAMQNVRGQVGTTVALEILHRDGERDTLTVERRLISTP